MPVADYQPWQFIQNHQSDGAGGFYERLLHIGHQGMSLQLPEYKEINFDYADGRTEYLNTGNLEGVEKMTLNMATMARSLGQGVVYNGNQVDLAEYIYNFWRRHTSPRRRPFIAPHCLTFKDSLWIFEQGPPTFGQKSFRIWETKLTLVQYVGKNNVIVDTNNNPDTI